MCNDWTTIPCLNTQAKGYSGPPRAVLIDVGTSDDFLEKQLKPEAFAEAAKGNAAIKLQLRMQARFPACNLFVHALHACAPFTQIPCRLLMWQQQT